MQARIVVNPKAFPGLTVTQVRQLIDDAEIVIADIDPIGLQVGEVRMLLSTNPASGDFMIPLPNLTKQ